MAKRAGEELVKRNDVLEARDLRLQRIIPQTQRLHLEVRRHILRARIRSEIFAMSGGG